MALAPGQDRLPCGTALDALVAQITDATPPPDPAHQAQCPFCQTALGDLRRGWDDLQDLARAPVPIPPGLTARVMTRVRSLARRAAGHVILAGPRGHTHISHDVVSQIARQAALTVPGVVFASARSTPAQPADAARLDLAIRVVATYGPALHALAAAVRATLRRQLPRLTGARAETIDITVADIARPATTEP
jgi:uncharacterized alkaline shock family protein YloU